MFIDLLIQKLYLYIATCKNVVNSRFKISLFDGTIQWKLIIQQKMELSF